MYRFCGVMVLPAISNGSGTNRPMAKKPPMRNAIENKRRTLEMRLYTPRRAMRMA
jgi:hypothetical protein